MGRYAEYQGPISLRHRVENAVRVLSRPRTKRLHPDDKGGGYTLHRELVWWTIRPVSGWGSRRWVSKPTHATRSIAKDDREAADDWLIAALGL